MGEDKEHEISQAEIDNWQRSKNRTVKLPDLEGTELLTFVRLVSEMANSGEFEIRLGLSRCEVEILKKRYNIQEADEAERMLKTLAVHNYLEHEHSQAREAQRVAQERLEAYTQEQERTREDRRERLRATLDANKIKQEDRERQERFSRELTESESRSITGWRITSDRDDPNYVSPERFKELLETRGWAFVGDKFGIGKQDIKAELKRLDLKVNYDLIPR